jgi:hypothetical protein
MPPNLCAALRGFIFANETVTLSVGRAPKTLLSFGRRYSRRFRYSGDFSRNITRIGSSQGRGSRGQLYPTGTGACGSVRKNSGSWPKKMRAPLCSNAPQPIKRKPASPRARTCCAADGAVRSLGNVLCETARPDWGPSSRSLTFLRSYEEFKGRGKDMSL